jgi:hypothetical protein
VITWHPTAYGESATVMAGGVVVARLNARPDAWQIEHHGGTQSGGATSVPGAKREALQKLAEVLASAAFEVDVALRAM